MESSDFCVQFVLMSWILMFIMLRLYFYFGAGKGNGEIGGSNSCEPLDPSTFLYPFPFPLPKSSTRKQTKSGHYKIKQPCQLLRYHSQWRIIEFILVQVHSIMEKRTSTLPKAGFGSQWAFSCIILKKKILVKLKIAISSLNLCEFLLKSMLYIPILQVTQLFGLTFPLTATLNGLKSMFSRTCR